MNPRGRLSRATVLAICEGASSVGGALGAIGFLGLWKVASHAWDFEGIGPGALWGSAFGILIGLPFTILMALTVFKKRRLPDAEGWGLWAIACLFGYGALGSFLVCMGSLVWWGEP
jgi:hypothetical protein